MRQSGRDETNHFFGAGNRIALQSKCQRKKEHDLRIRAPGDLGKQIWRGGEHEVALELMNLRNGSQEVQTLRPAAVVRGRDGYLRVFYEQLGLTFQTYEEWIAAGARMPRIIQK